jgi:hypothetical protein
MFMLLIAACKDTVKLDKTKLNNSYFYGEYQADYRGEIEKITIKENGYYDYAYGKNNDTLIKDVGKWSFDSTKHQYVYLNDYPNIRKNKLFLNEGKAVNMMMDINTHIEENLGNLSTVVIGEDEGEFIFIKLDKNKNKDYILKK